MRKSTLILLLLGLTMAAKAVVTTYTFTSIKWASEVGTIKTDGQTDGWVSDKDAYQMGTPRIYADGSLTSAGVGVTSSYSGAGAHSVLRFSDVVSVTVNFCQNSSKGRGCIYVQIGDVMDSIIVTKPKTSGSGVYNRDSTITFPTPVSGVIRFCVKCSENSIYLNRLTIRGADGGISPFTHDRYEMVLDPATLVDGDQVMIGVPEQGKLMGYFDESISQNNIHAISGKFSADGVEVKENEDAVYTLYTSTRAGETCYYFQDELRYEEAYLVASGGQTKNRLALWTHLTDEATYGDYGYWNITISPDGKATIGNRGNSLGRYLQYNPAVGLPSPLFGCYQQPDYMTPVTLYRRIAPLGYQPAIVAAPQQLGELKLEGEQVEATCRFTVNACQLSAPIQVVLDNAAYTSDVTEIDAAGGDLVLHFQATEPGDYLLHVTLTSGSVVASVPVFVRVLGQTATGWEEQPASLPAKKYLQQGRVLLEKDANRYNTNGQRL